MDPLGDVLYATNTNADLSFGGATVIAVDVLRHARAVECFKRHGNDSATVGDAECGTVSCADSGAALGSNATVEETEGREAVMKQRPADFDRCYCQWDLDDPSVVNCESQRFVLSDQTVKIGFFPGEMQLLAEDPPNWTALPERAALRRNLLIAVRGDPSITVVESARPLRRGRSGADSPEVRLGCDSENRPSDDVVSGPYPPHTPGESYTRSTCGETNRINRTPPAEDIPVDANDPSLGLKPRLELPTEPMSIFVDRGCIEPGYKHDRGTFASDSAQNPLGRPACYKIDGGRTLQGTYYQYLVSSHLPTGQVSSFDLGQNPTNLPTPRLSDVSGAMISTADGRTGAFAVAPRKMGDLSQPWYVTSKVTSTLSTFRLEVGPRVVPGLLFGLSGQFSASVQDVRSIVFEPSGDRAYLALFQPPAMAVVDTRLRGGGVNVPLNQVSAVVNLCAGPSRQAIAKLPQYSQGQVVLRTHVLTSCYLSGQVADVDPDTGELIATIQAGRGPLGLALNFASDETPTALNHSGSVDPCANPVLSKTDATRFSVTCPGDSQDLRPRPLGAGKPPLPPRVFVSNYLDNTISVLDFDPRSVSYRRMIARIGFPAPKQVQ
jgi:hypothetical protein